MVAPYPDLVEAIERTYARLVTQVASPTRASASHSRKTPTGSGAVPDPTTVPKYSVFSEATLATKLEALVELLCRRGVLDREEYLEEVRRIWEEREQ